MKNNFKLTLILHANSNVEIILFDNQTSGIYFDYHLFIWNSMRNYCNLIMVCIQMN